MKIIPKCNKTKRHLCASGSILLPLAQKWGLVGVVAIAALSAFATQSVSAASLTISVPGKLSVDVQPGGSAKESSPASFTVTSDAYWGYNLIVKSNDANGALTNGNSKINSIGPSVTSLSQFTNNTWGFKVSGDGVTNPDNYRQGPTTTTTNLATTTGKKGGQETETYSFTLAVKVDNTIPTGMYTGTFTFMATANAVNYTINYDDNDGADGPGKVTSQSQEQFVKIAAKEPTKQDRVFLGWCDQEVSNNGTCDGTIYQPGNDYEIKTANQNTTLYAMWDWITMQNWNDCSKNLVKNKQFTLVDSRDNRAYYVAKLADGNCWMTENLDFFIDASKTYTVADTDLDHATAEEKAVCRDSIPSCVDENGNYQWMPEKSTHAEDDHIWTNTSFNPESYDPGDKCWNGEKTYAIFSDHFNTDSHDCAKHDPSHYHIGNYYNYASAVAQDNTSDHSSDGFSYDTSICPAGWQLPDNNGEKSYINLKNAIAAPGEESPDWAVGYISKDGKDNKTEGQDKAKRSTVEANPYYLTYNGFWKGAFDAFGYGANYRSNTVVSDSKAYHFNFNSSGYLAVQDSMRAKSEGFAVRCVSRN